MSDTRASRTSMYMIPVSVVKHGKIGLASAIIGMGLVILYLITSSFIVPNPIPEPPKLTTVTEMEDISFEHLKVEQPTPVKGGGGGSGTPSDEPVTKNPPVKQIEQVLTGNKGNTKVPTGKGNKTNTNKPTNNDPKPDNSMTFPGSKGSGGTGGGNNGGKGNGYGGKDGNGNGPGPDGTGQGSGPTEVARKMVTGINLDAIQADVSCSVKLKLFVNEDGDVIDAKLVTSGTTTDNTDLIAQVIARVRSQLKFNPKPNAEVYVTTKLFKIKAS